MGKASCASCDGRDDWDIGTSSGLPLCMLPPLPLLLSRVLQLLV